MFGGMEILALDVLHMKDGREYIIELNDTAIGLMFEHLEEDSLLIRDLVIEKMNHRFCPENKI